MATQTDSFGRLIKPDHKSEWLSQGHANLETIDLEMPDSGPLSERPAANIEGRKYYCTNPDNFGEVYLDDGSSWSQIVAVASPHGNGQHTETYITQNFDVESLSTSASAGALYQSDGSGGITTVVTSPTDGKAVAWDDANGVWAPVDATALSGMSESSESSSGAVRDSAANLSSRQFDSYSSDGSDLAPLRSFDQNGNYIWGIKTRNLDGSGGGEAHFEDNPPYNFDGDVLAGNTIVETGSNSNGEYIRWENGLQICWHPLSRSAQPTTWTYPASFSSGPVIAQATCVNSSQSNIATVASVTNSDADVYVWDSDGSGNSSVSVMMIARGYWK